MNKKFKKKLNLIISIVVIFILTSCSNLNDEVIKDNIFTKEVIQSEDDEFDENIIENQNEEITDNISIYDLKNEELYDYIYLNDYIVSIPYNTNNDSVINRTISVFGNVLTTDEPKTVEHALTNKFRKIILYSNDIIVLEALTYNVKTVKSKIGCNFELELDVEILLIEQDYIDITSIKFEITDEISFELETRNFYLTIYNEMENNVKIIDCPLSFVNPVSINSQNSVTYTFLTANENYNENYNISIEIPNELGEFIKVESIDYYEDEQMKIDVEEVLNSQMSLQQKQDLRVITISVVYQKLTDSVVIIQPVINLDVIGEFQNIGAYAPLTI